MHKRFAILCIIVILGMIIPSISHAQLDDSMINNSDISVEISPKTPGPNEDVTITLTSYTVNLDKAKITWQVDSEKGLTNYGLKKFTVRTKSLGVPTTINLTIIFDTLNIITKKIVIRPAEVDLLWESTNAYVPPFYKGKAIPSSESTLNVVAIAHLKTATDKLAKDSELVYNWKRNYSVVQSGSGYAKGNLTFKASNLEKEQKINVVVSLLSQSFGAEQTITLSTGRPKILFYKYSPMTGLDLATALGKGSALGGTETTLFASPYFFSTTGLADPDLSYEWKINGRDVDTPKKPNVLVIRPTTNQVGVAQIDLSIESMTKLFELAKSQLSLSFNGQ